MWSCSVCVLNIEVGQDNVFKCVCVYLPPRIQIQTHTQKHTTMPWSDPPISSPSFRKAPKPTHASLFQLPFFPPSSPHRIYLNSPTVSFCIRSHIKCIHVSPSQTQTLTHTHAHPVTHHNLVIIISTLKH